MLSNKKPQRKKVVSSLLTKKNEISWTEIVNESKMTFKFFITSATKRNVRLYLIKTFYVLLHTSLITQMKCRIVVVFVAWFSSLEV